MASTAKAKAEEITPGSENSPAILELSGREDDDALLSLLLPSPSPPFRSAVLNVFLVTTTDPGFPVRKIVHCGQSPPRNNSFSGAKFHISLARSLGRDSTFVIFFILGMYARGHCTWVLRELCNWSEIRQKGRRVNYDSFTSFCGKKLGESTGSRGYAAI